MRRSCSSVVGVAVVVLAACGLDRARDDFYAHHWTRGGGGTESTGSGGSSSETSSGAGGSSETGAASTGVGEMMEGGESGTAESSTTTGGTTGAESSSGPGGPMGECGNGVREGDEECDDGNEEDQFDACTSQCARARIIFVTSGLYQGDVNTVGGADSLCRQAAGNAGLAEYLNYKALISDGEVDARDRLFHARGPYRLVNGLQVARDFEALMTETLEHPVDTTELGTKPAQPAVWTGTQPGGVAVPGISHCEGWTSSSIQDVGYYGRPTAVDGNWLMVDNPIVNPTDCLDHLGLYCLEQQ